MSLFLAFMLLSQTQEGSATELGFSIKTRVDYDAGLVYYEKWLDSLFMGVDSVKTLSDYLASAGRELYIEKTKENMRQKYPQTEESSVSGIIPDINIPIGKEKTDIRISGQDKISIGPSWKVWDDKARNDPNEATSLEFKQDINVSVKGTIARKTEVVIDHNTASSDLLNSNKVRIGYTGDEDEIVKKVDAGDIALNFPSRQQFPSQQGVFGVNGQFKLGSVDLYAVGAKEQTESGASSFTGMMQLQSGEIFAQDFVKKRFFYIFNDSLRNALIQNGDSVVSDFWFYTTDKTRSSDKSALSPSWNGTAMPNPKNIATDTSFDRETGTFYLLDKNEYYVRYAGSGLLNSVIELNSYLGDNDILAVACTTKTAGPLGSREDEQQRKAVLMLIWGRNTDDYATSRCWNNMLRNHYAMPVKEALAEVTVTVQVRDENNNWVAKDTNNLNYSYILGLTQKEGETHTLSQDEQRLWMIIFNKDRPFADSSLGSRKIEEIYDSVTVKNFNSFKITYEYKSNITSFDLGLLVKKESIKVKKNGNEVDKSEYTFDENSGALTFKTPIKIGDEINITFERDEVFSLNNRAILGLRAQSEPLKGIKLGSSLMFRNVAFSSDSKPILGYTPFSNTVAELDASMERELGFLTRLVDKLPLVATEAKSNFNLLINSALSIPNPNTHKSSAVWVEDFEQGTLESFSVPLGNEYWHPTSIPLRKTIVADSTIDTVMDTMNYSRNLPGWKTSEPFDADKDIFGKESSKLKSEYSDRTLDLTLAPESETRWTGLLGAAFEYNTFDISQSQFLEIIMKPQANQEGVIHFDYGTKIDEDELRLNAHKQIVGLGKFDTEDSTLKYEHYEPYNVGLDRVMGADTANVAGDDGNDDYDKDTNPNGTEGNSRMDSEDLRRDGFDRLNNYYELTVDFDNDTFFDKFVDTLGENGWIKISIPLGDTSFLKKFGTPSVNQIGMFRIWFEGMSGSNALRFYAWKFVGSKWKNNEVVAVDSSFVDTLTEKVFIDLIGSKDKEYKPPFKLGIKSTGEREDENSLRMRYENVSPNHAAKVTRIDERPQDFRAYQRLRVYVHNNQYNPRFYIRMGTDSLAYYEFRERIANGVLPSESQDGLWREFTLDFARFVELKDSLLADTSRRVFYSQDSTMLVKGRPTFASVAYMEVGVINDNQPAATTGEIWLDDIRLDEPFKDIGSTVAISSKLNFADLASLVGSFSVGDGKFVGINISSAPGARQTGAYKSFNVSGALNLEKFGLEKLDFKLPLTASITDNNSLPRFSGEITDKILTTEEQELRRQHSNVKNLGFSLSHNQSKSRLLQYTLDAVRASADYNLSSSLSSAGLSTDTSFSQSYSLRYNSSPDLFFKIGEEKINYFPNALNFSSSVIKTDQNRLSRTVFRSDSADVWNDTLFNQNAAITFNAGTSYSPVKYLPLSVDISETRAINASGAKNPNLKLDTLFDSKYFFVRDLRLSAGLSNVSFNSFGRPSVTVNSNFKEDHSQGVLNRNLDESGKVLYPNDRNLTNSGSLNLAWSGFDLRGLFNGMKANAQKRREEKAAKQAESDSLGTVIGVDDTLKIDSIPSDTIVKESAKSPEERMLETFGAVANIFTPINVSANFNRNSAFGNYNSAFDWGDNWQYVVGISDRLDSTVVRNDPNTGLKGWKKEYTASSGLNIAGVAFTGNVSYSRNRTNDIKKNETFNEVLTLPTISASYNNLGKLFEKVATSSQLRSSFSRVITTDWGWQWMQAMDTSWNADTIIDISPAVPDSFFKDTTINSVLTNYNFSPLLAWDTQWKEKFTSNISVNYGYTERKTPTTKSTTVTKNLGGSVNLGYTFNKPSGFKLGFLKHLKFKNDVTVNGTLSYNQTISENKIDTTQNTTTGNLSGNIQCSYAFSEAFDGGLTVSVNRQTGKTGGVKNNTDRTDYGIDLFVVFKF